jgi:hypothetical protein
MAFALSFTLEWLEKPFVEAPDAPLYVDCFMSNDPNNVVHRKSFYAGMNATPVLLEVGGQGTADTAQVKIADRISIDGAEEVAGGVRVPVVAQHEETYLCLDVIVPYKTSDGSDIVAYEHVGSVRIMLSDLPRRNADGSRDITFTNTYFHEVSTGRAQLQDMAWRWAVPQWTIAPEAMSVKRAVDILQVFLNRDMKDSRKWGFPANMSFLRSVRMDMDETSIGQISGQCFLMPLLKTPIYQDALNDVRLYLACLYAILKKYDLDLVIFENLFEGMAVHESKALWFQRLFGEMACLYPVSLIYLEDVVKKGPSRSQWMATENMDSPDITSCGDCEDLDNKAAQWVRGLHQLTRSQIDSALKKEPNARFVHMLKSFADRTQAGIMLCTTNSSHAGADTAADDYEKQYAIPGSDMNECAHMCCLLISKDLFNNASGKPEVGGWPLTMSQRMMMVECTGFSNPIKRFRDRAAMESHLGFEPASALDRMRLLNLSSPAVRFAMDSGGGRASVSNVIDNTNWYKRGVHFFTLDEQGVPEAFAMADREAKFISFPYKDIILHPGRLALYPHVKMSPVEYEACQYTRRLFNREPRLTAPAVGDMLPPLVAADMKARKRRDMDLFVPSEVATRLVKDAQMEKIIRRYAITNKISFCIIRSDDVSKGVAL